MAFSSRRLLYSPPDPYNEPPLSSPPLAPLPMHLPPLAPLPLHLPPISQPPSPLTVLPLTSPKHRHFLSNNPLIGLVIGVSLLFGIVFMAVSRYWIKRRESRQRIRRNPTNPRDLPILFDTQEGFRFLDEEQGPQLDHPIWYIRSVGLDQSVINSIALFKYKKGEGMIDGTDCSVCLTEFDEDETLRLLPKCSHAFHVPCIDTWLRSHQNCPLCRATVIRTVSEAANSSPGESSTEILIAPVRVSEDREEAGSTTEMLPNSENSETRVLIRTGDSPRVAGGNEMELQGLRRSVSMDAASASVVYRAGRIATSGKGLNLNLNSESRVFGGASILYRVVMKSCSFGSSHQEHPPLKRSSSSK